ncbi:hypothetical protein RsTz2092_08770 [Deferribacterales bacterium RsTz2092]|nr:hypothetical protein AGMMS49941_06040 [Deferribacterales bacterium]
MNVPKLNEQQLKTLFSIDDVLRAESMVGQCYDCTVSGGDLSAKIRGNHGVYSIKLKTLQEPMAYEGIGEDGEAVSGKYFAALGLTYIYTPWKFKVEGAGLDRSTISSADDIQLYIALTPLRQLLDELKTKNVPLAAFADMVHVPLQQIHQAMNDGDHDVPHTLLGPLKFACLYMLEKLK